MSEKLYLNNQVILIIEDNFTDVFLIEDAFERANLEFFIQLVENGQKAIDYLTGKNGYVDRGHYPLPVLIITDVELPGMSGLDLLKWIKKQSQFNHIPVVVMSGENNEKEALKIGANLYIYKIPNFKNLCDLVKTILVLK